VSSQEEAQKLLDDLSGSRLLELFEAYGVHLVAADIGQVAGKTLDCCGLVGFSGQGIRGSLAVAGSNALLAASNPAPGGAPRDWVGELANQLMGHVKSRLLGHKVEVFVSIPILLRGERVALEVRGLSWPRIFADASGTGHVALWVDVETTPEFQMTSEEDPTLSGLGGGEVLIF
jgi:hypothetical protein